MGNKTDFMSGSEVGATGRSGGEGGQDRKGQELRERQLNLGSV